jgi:hypothetical protein
LGYRIPAWLSLNIDVSITIAVGAIVMGLLGFLLHRICVATMFALLVAGISAFIFHDQVQPVERPDTSVAQAVQTTPTLSSTVVNTWRSAPPVFGKYVFWIAGGAFLVAWLLAFFFRRFGMAALYSIGGTLLTLASIRLGHASDHITWLDSLKTGPMTTATLGFCILLVGFMAQMALLYRNEHAPERQQLQPAAAL